MCVHIVYNMKSKRNDKLPLSIHDVSQFIIKNLDSINRDVIPTIKEIEMVSNHIIKPLKGEQFGDISYLTPNLNAIFGTYGFKRKSVLSNVKVPSNKDVSIVSALLHGSIENYFEFDKKMQIDLTEKMIRKCLKDHKAVFKNNLYAELGWTMGGLRKALSEFTVSRELLRYYVDTLYVNLFILDIEKDSLLYVGSDVFIKHKKNIFVVKFGNSFELMYQEPNIYSFKAQEPIIRKLINSSFLVEKIDCNLKNKDQNSKFIVGDEAFEIDNNGFKEASEELDDDDIHEIIGLTEAAEFSEYTDGDVEAVEPVKPVEAVEAVEPVEPVEPVKPVEPKMTMTKEELIKMAKDYNIDLYCTKNKKRVQKTKAQLVDDIKASKWQKI